MRQRGVAAFAAHGDLEFAGGRHHRPRRHRKRADRHARPVVHAEHRLHREFVEQAVLHHLARAAAAFLGRLKDQIDGAVEIAVRGQMLRGGQQHRGVAVVPARVHAAVVHALVRKIVALLDRQRIHVGAQADRTVAAAVLDDADHAGGAHAAMNRDAPFGQLGGYLVGGAVLGETQFRMCVQVAPHGGDCSCGAGDGVDDVHAKQCIAAAPVLVRCFTSAHMAGNGFCQSTAWCLANPKTNAGIDSSLLQPKDSSWALLLPNHPRSRHRMLRCESANGTILSAASCRHLPRPRFATATRPWTYRLQRNLRMGRRHRRRPDRSSASQRGAAAAAGRAALV